MIVALIIAVIIGGALIAAQGPIYTRMATDLGGPIQAAMLAFALGAAALLALLAASGGTFPRRAEITSVPIWAWFGGLIGVYVVLISILAVPRMGVAGYMVCVILGQVLAGYIYDAIGAFGMAPRAFSLVNITGLGMVAVGATLVIWR